MKRQIKLFNGLTALFSQRWNLALILTHLLARHPKAATRISFLGFILAGVVSILMLSQSMSRNVPDYGTLYIKVSKETKNFHIRNKYFNLTKTTKNVWGNGK